MLPSGLPDIVSDEEALARFLVSSRWYNAKGPKHEAFLPYPEETSVFRHSGDPPDELWSLFTDHVRRPSTLHGAAIVMARDVRSAKLEVIASEPPPKHAAIRGWPIASDPALQKAQQKERALLVASKATVLRKNAS
jgi:uncharacterized protein YodC (DUF2158 family)